MNLHVKTEQYETTCMNLVFQVQSFNNEEKKTIIHVNDQ